MDDSIDLSLEANLNDESSQKNCKRTSENVSLSMSDQINENTIVSVSDTENVDENKSSNTINASVDFKI